MLLLAAMTAMATAGPPDPAYVEALLADAAVLRLHERREWRVLGHYKGRDVGQWMSQADGDFFFLAAEFGEGGRPGKHDPEAELRATIRALAAPPVAPWAPEAGSEEERSWTDQHPQCRFPARTRWLYEALSIDEARLPRQPCPDLDDWKARLAPTSVTLVFADAYMGNPASMFGHTFLRLDKAEGKDLLATTVNFAADPWTTNPLIYPVAGIVGWFPGLFATLPYYLKVREYNALENRDLWEYPLDLDADAIDRMLDHLWEVGPTPFRYHYFDENCSYQLLALLEGMDPDLRLTDRYTAWVFPTSTLRTVVTHTDLAGTPVRRLSRHGELVARRDALPAEDRPLARRLARHATESDLATAAALPERRAADVLDAAYELHRYRAGDAPEGEARARDQRLLLARGKVAAPPREIEVPAKAPPHAGHRPGMAAVGAGLDHDGVPFARLRLRPALHDLLATQQSYVPGSKLEMMHVAVDVTEGEGGGPRPVLERFSLFSAASLARSERWLPRMAWRLETGWNTRWEALAAGDCAPRRQCLAYELSGGPGLAVGSEALTAFTFVEGEAAVGPGVGRHLRLGPGVAGGVLVAPVAPLRLRAEGRARYGAWGADGLLPGLEALAWQLEAAGSVHLSGGLELRALGRHSARGDGPSSGEGAAELWWYW